MTPIIILITVGIYFLVQLAIAFRKKQTNNADFFSGSRQSKWYIVAFAMIGASISGVTYVSVPGMVSKSGFGYLQLVLGFIVGQLIIAFVLTPLFYRMKLTSVYEYLSNRFGLFSYHTGAWFFFISKMLGAAIRLFLVCFILQMLAFEPLSIPFYINVIISVTFVWLYTFRGGVKSVIWADVIKTFCLIISVILCIYFIAKNMGFTFTNTLQAISQSNMSKMFFFDNPNDKQFFFKQFLAGIFTMIATNGLDQDMMQRNLSCRNSKESQKNMIFSIILQFVVVAAFLMLGVLLYLFANQNHITETGDKLFPTITTGGYLPVIVGILFIIGLVSSAYNAAGSALTSLTTSFTIDILGAHTQNEKHTKELRYRIHIIMAGIMALAIIGFNLLNSTTIVDAVYTLVSYTYGPILGMFAFGIITKSQVRDKFVPLVATAAPILCFILDKNSVQWFSGYQFSYELLILNALFTFIGLCLLIKQK